MSTSVTVRRHLDKQEVRYATMGIPGEDVENIYKNGSSSIPARQVAKAVLLKDDTGLILAVIPGPNHIRLSILNRQLHRYLEPADSNEISKIFAGIEPNYYPPLGEIYNLETVLDDALLGHGPIYFSSGVKNELLRVNEEDFLLLHCNSWFCHAFSSPTDETQTDANQSEPVANPITDLKDKIERLSSLPPMPNMALHLMKLNANPNAQVKELANIIENDPSLAAQIVRYAQSPFYGYSGQISSIKQAITRVLGFDMVMNIALGIAASRPFKTAANGPLGIHSYWRHATYCAVLAQALCQAMPKKIRPNPGTAYLCGLLHNFGFLILGYLFPQEYSQLNDLISNNPDSPVLELEQALLKSDHTEIGRWLMSAWNMPLEIINTVSQHHNPDYQGRNENYVKLIYLSDALLAFQQIGDGSTLEIPETVYESLGLNLQQIHSILENVIKGRDNLDLLARQLAA